MSVHICVSGLVAGSVYVHTGGLCLVVRLRLTLKGRRNPPLFTLCFNSFA